MARPSKFTPETIRRLLEAIALGATYAAACRYAGITFETFNQWRRGHVPRLANPKLKAEFSDGLTRAEAEAEMYALAAIRTAAANGEWRAAAWWLERRHPRDYGKVALLGGVTGTPIEIRKLIDLAARAEGLDPASVTAEAERIMRAQNE